MRGILGFAVEAAAAAAIDRRREEQIAAAAAVAVADRQRTGRIPSSGSSAVVDDDGGKSSESKSRKHRSKLFRNVKKILKNTTNSHLFFKPKSIPPSHYPDIVRRTTNDIQPLYYA